MTERHGKYAAHYPIVGLDVSAANKYDPPNTDPYNEPAFLSHLNFLIFRLSLSSSRDMDAPYHAQLVADQGITSWMVYLAPKIGRSNWQAQVDNSVEFLEQFRRDYGLPLIPPMGVAIDVERRSLDPNINHTKLSITNWLIKYTNRCADAFGENNLRMYTNMSSWDTMTYKTDRFKNIPLWNAQYNDWIQAPTLIPRDWREHNNLVQRWLLWQWAAEGFKIDGLPSGKHVGVHSSWVDFNRYYGSVAEFKKDFGCEPWVYDGEVVPPIPPVPPDPPEDSGYPIGEVNTGGTGQTLWTHTEPNSLVSTRKGALPEGLEVVIEDTTNDGDWYLLKHSKNWASAKYIDMIAGEHTA